MHTGGLQYYAGQLLYIHACFTLQLRYDAVHQHTRAPELIQENIRAGKENDAEGLRLGECGGRRDIVGGTDVQKT